MKIEGPPPSINIIQRPPSPPPSDKVEPKTPGKDMTKGPNYSKIAKREKLSNDLSKILEFEGGKRKKRKKASKRRKATRKSSRKKNRRKSRRSQ